MWRDTTEVKNIWKKPTGKARHGALREVYTIVYAEIERETLG